MTRIPRGTYLFDYTGEVLSKAESTAQGVCGVVWGDRCSLFFVVVIFFL